MAVLESRWRGSDGQASVELVCALPFVLLLGALAWQLAVVGQTSWLAAHAARAAARADVVDRDPRPAARSVVPANLERGMEVARRRRGVVVRLRVPFLLRRWSTPLEVEATASLRGAG